ncbi:transcriptional regulator, AraC family [Pseudoalteromonas sp. SW0106-04]|uniref:AraC family transcriptional regulator n=1 Tax=Pseudoalteromonas sp. SW0106-04 TaxID=1702169 RepID=UPI0006B40DED|nr:helix-turn-helix domain-containing protein [Pseudoalteromonas sp. SW0106-04]GAP73577.1 transcriptional regulator, AraC family [Pseudoalteromonas sp. SW0106-04]
MNKTDNVMTSPTRILRSQYYRPLSDFALQIKALYVGGVAQLWQARTGAEQPYSQQLLHADARMGLLALTQGQAYLGEQLLTPGLYITGCQQHSKVLSCAAGTHLLGARFHLAAQGSFIRQPAAEMVNQCIRIDDIDTAPQLHRAARFSEAQPFFDLIKTLSSHLPRQQQVLSGAAIEVCTNSADLAEQLGKTPRTIERYCKHHIGISLRSIHKLQRVARARERIKHQRQTSLTELSYALNFADQAHFSRQFKQVVGLSPRDYQQLKWANRPA